MTAYGVERPTLYVNQKIIQQGRLIGDVVPQSLCCRIELTRQGFGRRQKIRVPVKLFVQFHLALTELQTSNSYLGKKRRVRLKNEYPVCCAAVRDGLPKRPGYVGACSQSSQEWERQPEAMPHPGRRTIVAFEVLSPTDFRGFHNRNYAARRWLAQILLLARGGNYRLGP